MNASGPTLTGATRARRAVLSALAAGAICLAFAALPEPALCAERFTLTRIIAPTSISHTDATGRGISVNFVNANIESPPADAAVPGVTVPLLSYTVTTIGDPDDAVSFAFADEFTLAVLLTFYPGGNTHTLLFRGAVSGSVRRGQNHLDVRLSLDPPVHPEAQTFAVGGTSFTVSNVQSGPPPCVDDTSIPGTVSAYLTGEERATAVVSVAGLPAEIAVGGGAIGRVTLDRPAPAPGVLVRLMLPLRASYEQPPTVLVPGGATSASFPLVALLEGGAEVGAEYNGTLSSAGLTITTVRCRSADVDGDGTVGLSDVVRILRIYGGLETLPG